MKKNDILERKTYENDNDKIKGRNSDAEYLNGFKNEPEELQIEAVKNDNIVYHKSIKIILIGDSKVGKTSILHRLLDNKYDDKYIPSLNLEYTNYTIKINNYIIRMQIWDSPGQEKYEPDSLISNYYKNTQVLIFVYDINELASFKKINEYFKHLVEEKGEQNHIKKILLGNKLDLGNERQVEYSDAENFSKTYNFDIFSEISCKNEDYSNNIKNIFDSIGKIFYEEHLTHKSFIRYLENNDSIGGKEHTKDDYDEKRKCCYLCNIL